MSQPRKPSISIDAALSKPPPTPATTANERADLKKKVRISPKVGDNGTVAILSQFGELLSLTQILADANGEPKCVSAETRDCVSADMRHPKQWRGYDGEMQAEVYGEKEDPASNEDKDSDNDSDRDSGDEEEGRKPLEDWESPAGISPHYHYRKTAFNRLYEKAHSGFGLRLAADTGKLELHELRYREDRWPEFQLVRRKNKELKIDVQYFVDNNQLFQQYTITSTDSDTFELCMDIDFTAALRYCLLGTVEISPRKSYDNLTSVRKLHGSGQVAVEGSAQKLIVTLFRDNSIVPLNGFEENEDISVKSPEEITHRERVQIAPGEVVTFTAVYAILNKAEQFATLPVLPSGGFDRASGTRWWDFKKECKDSSFTYRRSLEHILCVTALPLPTSHPGYEGVRPYMLLDNSLSLAHEPQEGYMQLIFLLGMFELFSTCHLADPVSTERYLYKIQEVAKGYLLWLCEMKTNPSDDDRMKVLIEGESETPDTDPDRGWIQTTNVAERYCDRLIALHRFARLFPGESDFTRKILCSTAPKTWEHVRKVQDSDTDMVSDIFRREYLPRWVPIKYFELNTQIMVWRAMDAFKKLLKILDISTQDKIRKIWETDPHAFRRNVIERFTVEENPSAASANGGVCRQLMATHMISGAITFRISPRIMPLLVSALDGSFFSKDDLAIGPWNETLNQTELWPFCPENKPPDEFVNCAVLNLLLVRYRDGTTTHQDTVDARMHLEAVVSDTGLLITNRSLHQIGWQSIMTLLFNDYEEQLSPAKDRMEWNRSPVISPTPNVLRTVPGSRTADTRDPAPPLQSSLRDDVSKKRRKLDLSKEDQELINEKPEYGPAWLFHDLWFFSSPEHRISIPIKSFVDVKTRLLQLDKVDEEDFFATWLNSIMPKSHERTLFIERMTKTPGTALNFIVDFGKKPTVSKLLGHHHYARDTVGASIINRLIKPRVKATSKKRVIVVENMNKAFLMVLCATHVNSEAYYLGIFIESVIKCTPMHVFETLIPEGIWETRVCIKYIQHFHPFDDIDTGNVDQSHFHAKRWPLRDKSPGDGRLSSLPDWPLREAAFGFSIIGDIHDRHWTAYIFHNYDADLWDLTGDAFRGPCPSDNMHQRKILEGCLVARALHLLLMNTRSILGQIDQISQQDKYSLFDQFGTDRGSGEHNFNSRYKHSVLFPWLLELLRLLSGHCDSAQTTVDVFLQSEKNFKHKPRWSKGDQIKYGEQLRKNRKKINSQLTKIREVKGQIGEKIAWFTKLKEWIASDLALQDARRSIILSESARIFTVVTLIFLPLSFSSSIVAIDGLSWGSPLAGLFKIIAAVSAFTIIILVNLDFIDRWTWYLLANCHKFLRMKMKSEPGGTAKTAPIVDPESGGLDSPDLATGFWGNKAGELESMDDRKEIMGEGVSQLNPDTSAWWYWLFLVFYSVVKLPMTEVAFAVEVTWRKVPRVGPLQKIFRLAWVPLWLLLLSLVYVVLMVGDGLVMVWGLICKGLRIAWQGTEEEKKKEGKERGTDEADKVEEQVITPEVEQPSWNIPWWRKPLHAMEYGLVLAAHRKRMESPTEATPEVSNSSTTAVNPTTPVIANVDTPAFTNGSQTSVKTE